MGWGPADTTPEACLCDANLCIHWVESTEDAPPGADGDPSTVPGSARTTLAVFQQVWATEVDAMGYRAPKSDLLSAENGGDGRLDVYLADVGDTVFGYCASDDPDVERSSASAYRVVDDDFSRTQFPGPTSGLAALERIRGARVLSRVQFSYDYLEDTWLMEGTAVCIEDEVFDDVDDNRQFLNASSLSRPTTPLDVSSASTTTAPGSSGATSPRPSTLASCASVEAGARGKRAWAHSLAATRAAVTARGLPSAQSSPASRP